MDKIPAELRNAIYELVFVPGHDEKERESHDVSVQDAKPPPKALLCSCRKVYNEGKNMYSAAYRRYWSTTPFILRLNEQPAQRQCGAKLQNLPIAVLEYITRFKIEWEVNFVEVNSPEAFATLSLTLVDIRDGWKREVSGPNTPASTYLFIKYDSVKGLIGSAYYDTRKELVLRCAGLADPPPMRVQIGGLVQLHDRLLTDV